MRSNYKKTVITNLVKNSSFEDMSTWSTWSNNPTDSSQSKYGNNSLKLGGGDALAQTQIAKPIVGHKYYGREWIKTNGKLTADDCRFEINSLSIPPEEPHIFGWNQGSYPDWTMISDVITIDKAEASSYIVRTFTVNGSVDAWVDGLVIVDLTSVFGDGNEPTKEWCDVNIPWFEGTITINIPSNLDLFDRYLKVIKEDFRPAIKVEWLNSDESVNFEFTNALYKIDVDLSVNYKNGSRRSCTLTLNNDRNAFPIDFDNIWIGQKFKLWMGVYLDSETPYYFPQGVFYVSNPEDVYNPSTRTVTLNGVDKWAYLDGTLFGRLSGTYQTSIDDNLYSATRKLLQLSRYKDDFSKTTNKEEMIDPIFPLLSPAFKEKKATRYTKDKETDKITKLERWVWECPYTAIVERGGTFADVLLEYATILCASIYYDVNGRLVLEPMINTAEDITDTNKEILWHYTIDEKTFLGLTQKHDFEKIHNDFIVLGNIVNGYQFKGRVQNRNPRSNTCVQRIGLRTMEPYEDNQYYSDEQCKELATYYAKAETILQKSGDISSVTLYHLDVNKLVTVSTPNNNMSKELFLITGFSLSASGSMTLNIASVNVLEDFSVVEAEVII